MNARDQAFLKAKDAALKSLASRFPSLIRFNPLAKSKSGWKRFDLLVAKGSWGQFRDSISVEVLQVWM